jgi:small subunit ribosomal protein S4
MPHGIINVAVGCACCVYEKEGRSMKYNGPKVRVSRYLGIALTPKSEKVMQKKAYPPGVHGPNMRSRKESVYKRQLMEKQRVRALYNIHERQMRNYYRKASRLSMNTATAMIHFLEMRLDATVAHGGFARTIYASRQYVGHGHFLVNGHKVDVSSYQVKPGDVISMREKSKKMACFAAALDASPTQPPYLQLDRGKMEIHVLRLPDMNEVPMIDKIDFSQVVEFYSR